MSRLLPTGKCWCGCGADTGRGSFFVQGHDRRATTQVIAAKYGGVPEFLDAHGRSSPELRPAEAEAMGRAYYRRTFPAAVQDVWALLDEGAREQYRREAVELYDLLRAARHEKV